MGTLYRSFNEGVDAVSAAGQKDTIAFVNAWAAGDTWDVRFVTTAGAFNIGQAVDGQGKPVLVGTTPTFAYTLGARVWLANGTKFNFSDNNDPTGWYEQNTGAGFVYPLINGGGQDTVQAFCSYQGYLAVFLRNTIQIWAQNADPTLFQIRQVLNNIGTPYGLTVQGLGDWDVLFLADSGVRSLRVRDSSLNAFTNDIGSPIDGLIQEVIAADSIGTPIAVVDPSAVRYWLFLKDTIYVLSNFPEDQVKAWATYDPTFLGKGTQVVPPFSNMYDGAGGVSYLGTPGGPHPSLIPGQWYYWDPGVDPLVFLPSGGPLLTKAGLFQAGNAAYQARATGGVPGNPITCSLTIATQTAFVPSKYVIQDGQVICRATSGGSDYLVTYGGGYDNCVASIQSPYYSLQAPSTDKYAQGLDFALQGTWALSVSFDQASEVYEAVGPVTGASYDGGMVSVGAEGSHCSFKLVSSALESEECVLSSISFIFLTGDNV